MTTRSKFTNIAALLASASIVAGTFFLDSAEKTRLHQERRSLALSQLSSIRANLEGLINSTLLLTTGVVAHIATHPDISVPEFHLLAKELLPRNPHIRNIGLARDNVITHMYPVKGNEAAIGLRYMDNPKQRTAVIRAIETRKTVVAGPVNLVQGGLGFISRTPVFSTPAGGETGSGEYWGLASMVINADTLLEVAVLSSDLTISLRGKDGLGERGEIFFGEERVFRSDPVLLDVTLPAGSWQIAAIPAEGWHAASSRGNILMLSGFLIAAMVGSMIWMFGRLSDEILRRRVEEVSAESDRKVKELAESLTEVVSRRDAHTFETTYVNKAIEKIYGYTVKEWLANPSLWEESIHPDDRKHAFETIQEAREKDKDFSYQYRIIKKDKMVRWVEDRVAWGKDDKGNTVSADGFLSDITEQKRAEEALKESEQKYRSVVENIGIGVALISPDMEVVALNKQMKEWFPHIDVTRRPVCYRSFNSPPIESACSYCPTINTLLDGKVYESVTETPAGDKVLNYRIISSPIKDENGKVVSAIEMVEDITEQKQAEDALRESNDRFRNLVETTSDWVWEVDKNGFYTYASPKVYDLLGYQPEDILGKTPFDLMAPDEASRVAEIFTSIVASRRPFNDLENTSLHKDGYPVVLETSGVPILDTDDTLLGYRGIDRDITMRKNMEDELLKSQKLESVGLLAGGIAHDFNNILAVILNSITYVEKHGGLEGKLLEYLEDTKNVTNHARSLTQQLLTFSKGGDPVRKTASISLLLKDSIDFFLSGSKIKCEFSIPPDLWPAEVDKGQISQVINNIIINADQAMPDGGEVEVVAENIELKDDTFLSLPEGKYLKILIRDNGVGIKPENIQKIFDPYFTTKEMGTGLGLTATYSIIKKHGGNIQLNSEPGIGSTFTVYLPASDKELVIENKPFNKSSNIQKSKILLMEDEERLGKVVQALLQQLGYDVDLTKDGSEAIELFQERWNSNQPFDAVVMDLTIPGGMGGKEAMKGLVKIDPNVKAIVTSGYSNDPVLANFKDYGFSGVIPKPYDVDELREKLSEILDTPIK